MKDQHKSGREVTLSKVVLILLGFAIIITWHLDSWQQGTGCLIGRAPLREPPPPGATCLISFPQGGYVYSRCDGLVACLMITIDLTGPARELLPTCERPYPLVCVKRAQ